jgi:predicted transcriptional regulator
MIIDVPTEIADETGMKLNNAKQLLRNMVKDGGVLKTERAKYALPERVSNE